MGGREEAKHEAYKAAEAVAQEILGVPVHPMPFEVPDDDGRGPWVYEPGVKGLETPGDRDGIEAGRADYFEVHLERGPPVVRITSAPWSDPDVLGEVEAEPIVAVFVCPRCGEEARDEEGGTDSPVCASCWHEITDGGQEPVPQEWRWPSDGGPEISDEAAGLSYRLWAPRGEVASFVVDEEGVARCHCCAKLICLRCTAANNRKPVSHAPGLFEKAKRESGEAAYRCEIDWHREAV